jgi:hypothetical protein
MEHILIPADSGQLGGEAVAAKARVLADRDGKCVVEIPDVPTAVAWLEDFEFVYAQRQRDGTLKAIRKASSDELKEFRVPVWIQDEEIPDCCGQAMHFVGQLDDNSLCAEPPIGAESWWHDAASFYVFTCSRCLSVKAVGQQF